MMTPVNPFARRGSHGNSYIITFRALSSLTWILVVTLCFAYTVYDPQGASTIQDQNAVHPTPFALDPNVTGVYWFVNARPISKS